jgi:4-nitrophenyl phosphatase
MSKMNSPKIVLCDLDGVIWLAHQPIEGSTDAVARLRQVGIDVLFVTNNSFSTRDQQHAALASVGIAAEGNVITSAMAASTHVSRGERVLVCGGEGLIEEVGHRGAEVVVPYRDDAVAGDFDAVVVGFHREFNFDVLSAALTAVRNGARLIGSNSDPTYPTPQGPIPGGGSILAAIEHATGVKAVVTGKPHQPMADLVASLHPGVGTHEMMMVGDVVSTDGEFARTLGCAFGLVLSGMTSSAEGIDADIVGANLAAIVDQIV